jgi:hypothetical protein
VIRDDDLLVLKMKDGDDDWFILPGGGQEVGETIHGPSGANVERRSAPTSRFTAYVSFATTSASIMSSRRPTAMSTRSS